MLKKPEICIGLESYGQRTEQEYEWLTEDWESRVELDTLHNLLMCVYKDGVKDGIDFCRQLDTD